MIRILLSWLGKTLRFFWVLPGVLLLVIAWLLGTQSGSQLLLDQAAARSGGLLDVGTVTSGSLLRKLRLDHANVTVPGTEIEVSDLQLDWSPLSLLALLAQVDRLHAGRIDVRLHPVEPPPEPDDTPFTPPPSWLPVAIVVRGLSVGELRVQPPESDALITRNLALQARWVGQRITLGRLQAEIEGYGALDLDARARLSDSGAQLERLTVRAPFPVEASARYHYDGAFEAALDWRTLRWPLDEAPAQFESAQGQFRIDGRLDAYRLTLDAALRTEGQDGRIQLQGEGSTQHLALQQLDLRALGGTAQAQGRVQWAPELALDLTARLRNLNPGALVSEWPGRISGDISAQGRLDGQDPLRFTADLRDSQLRDQPFAFTARGGWHQNALRLEQAELRQGVTRLRASGLAWPQLDLRAELDSSDLSTLLPELRGRIDLQAQLQGEPTLPRATARGQGENLGWNGLASLRSLTLDGHFDPQGDLGLHVQLTGIDGPQVIDEVRLDLDGRIAQHHLRLRTVLPQLQLELSTRGGADLERQRWRGQLETLQLSVENLPPIALQAPADLRLAADAVELGSACLAATDPALAKLCLAGKYTPALTQARATIESLDYRLAQAFMPEEFSLSGGLSGHADIRIRGARTPELDVDLRTRAGALALRNRDAMTLQDGHLKLKESAAGAEVDIDLPVDDGGLRLLGRVGPHADLQQRPLDLQLDARLDDLAWINRLSPEFQDLEGQVSARIQASGTVGNPTLVGTAELQLPQIHLVAPGITLTQTQARLTATPDGNATVTARTHSGEQALTLDGSLFIDAESPRADLRLTGDNVQLVDIADARVWLSPDLQIAFAGMRLDVTGRVDVPRADITPRGGEGSGTGPSGDQIVVREGEGLPGPSLMQVFANVTVRLGEAVTVSGFGLNTHLRGQLTAQQTPGQPTTGRGEIRLEGGRYKAYGQDLDIQTGRLLFSGGPLTDPAIDIRAIRKPRDDIEVGVTVRGRLDRPEFALFSSPSMPQDEQLGWLILGRPLPSGTGSGDDQAMLANAAIALGLSGSDFLAQRLKGGLGIDDISIGSRPGEDADQARLTIGKYLSPDLYVSYGIGLFQPGHVFRLLYDIGRGFKLQTETGVVSGADVLYTVER